MDICACMYMENKRGDKRCHRCRKNIYGCNCPLIHARGCSNEKDDTEDQRERVIQVDRLVQVLGLSRTHKLVRRE